MQSVKFAQFIALSIFYGGTGRVNNQKKSLLIYADTQLK